MYPVLDQSREMTSASCPPLRSTELLHTAVSSRAVWIGGVLFGRIGSRLATADLQQVPRCHVELAAVPHSYDSAQLTELARAVAEERAPALAEK